MLSGKINRILKTFCDVCIESVYDGEECLKRIAGGRTYDVILMDQHMGSGLQGVQTIAALRGSQGYTGLVVGFSGAY